MGEINFVDGTGDGTAIATPLGPIPHNMVGDARVAIRPEHLMETEGVDLGKPTATDVAFFGTFCRVTLAAKTGTLFAQVPPERAPRHGDTVTLTTDPKHMKVFAR